MEKTLLIHDLPKADFDRSQYGEIVENNGKIENCIGCFSCWVKTPMVCAIKDGYEKMAEKLAACDRLILVSKCVYGGPSPFVKNALDRSIPYLHPNFIIKGGQMHHKQRFAPHIALTMLFYGEDLTVEEKETAKEWTKAMAINFDLKVEEITFYENIKNMEERL